MSADHALLSPSSAHRWMACPPSARLESQYPDSTSDAADEGTLAHALAEYKLRLQYRTGEAATPEQLHAIKADRWYSAEMETCTTNYADFVAGLYEEAKRTTPDAVLFVEERLDLRAFVPEAYGTADAVIIADGLLTIVDLKYGKGVAVSAERNPQMMIYAAGALRLYSVAYKVDRVQMYIYQPRLDSCTTYAMSATELAAWVKDSLTPAAKLAHRGGGEQQIGDHCRFCKARCQCTALADKTMALAAATFDASAKADEDRIADVLAVADTVTAYINAVKDYALQQALKGETIKGFKVVEGRSIRQVRDESGLVTALAALGFGRETLYASKLKGITDLEKIVGKAAFAEVAGRFIVKPAGAPTLVPVSDKREEYVPAEIEFRD